jgi:hypothetical protein
MKKFLLITFLILFFSAHGQKKKSVYIRFLGNITAINEEVIKYDDEILIIYETDIWVKEVFQSGIIYPGIIREAAGIPPPKKPVAGEITHNLTVQKLIWMKPKPKYGKIRVFKFLLYQNDINNPTEYFVELTNSAASFTTPMRRFIKEAKLKSIKKGNVLILPVPDAPHE